jgi:hypothetical protein
LRPLLFVNDDGLSDVGFVLFIHHTKMLTMFSLSWDPWAGLGWAGLDEYFVTKVRFLR